MDGTESIFYYCKNTCFKEKDVIIPVCSFQIENQQLSRYHCT